MTTPSPDEPSAAAQQQPNPATQPPLTGLALAESIEADARQRLKDGRDIDLRRYIEAIADLRAEPTAVDAAIDMAIRGLMRQGKSRTDAAAHLADEYPHLREAIEVALELDNAMWSTQSINRYFDPSHTDRQLPCFFGASLDDGHGRYELRELLGTGSFGQVYLARDRQLSDDDHDALVSVKILPARAGDQWIRWLSDEATKARRVRHRNVVSVLDRDTTAEGEVYIVYEYVEGGDLRDAAESRDEQLAPVEAARIIAQIADGAHAAHMAGLVHCDLKPSNIVLTAEGEPKVADFGVARRYRGEDAGAPTDDRIGNPAFMSPEQYRMEPGSLTIPTDIYALGGMLYWLVTGAYPNGDTPAEIARRHQQRDTPPPSMRDVRREVDPDLDCICQRAMATEPEARHDSARSLANDLRRWANHEPIDWMRVSPLRRAQLWMRRRPAAAVSLMVGGVVVLGSVILAAAFAQSAAIKQRQIELDEEYQSQFFDILSEFEQSFQAMQDEGQYDRVFRDIWFSRWLYEPGRWIEPRTMAEKIDRMRIDTVELQLQRLREQSTPTSLRVLMWEGCLAFWYVHEQRWADALEVIETTTPKTRQVLDRDDPWHLHLAALRAIATWKLGRASDLEATQRIIAAAEQDLLKTAKWSPMHLLMLGALAELYSPEHLNLPERAKAVHAALEAADQADTF